MDLKKLKTIVDVLVARSEADDDQEVSTDHDELYLGGPPPNALVPAEAEILKRAGAVWSASHGAWRVYT